MRHVEGREPVIAARIGVVLNHRLAATANRAGVVERLGIGVARHEHEAARHAPLQTHLQRIEVGECAGCIVREPCRVRCSVGYRTEPQKLVEVDAARAGVHHFEECGCAPDCIRRRHSKSSRTEPDSSDLPPRYWSPCRAAPRTSSSGSSGARLSPSAVSAYLLSRRAAGWPFHSPAYSSRTRRKTC